MTVTGKSFPVLAFEAANLPKLATPTTTSTVTVTTTTYKGKTTVKAVTITAATRKYPSVKLYGSKLTSCSHQDQDQVHRLHYHRRHFDKGSNVCTLPSLPFAHQSI